MDKATQFTSQSDPTLLLTQEEIMESTTGPKSPRGATAAPGFTEEPSPYDTNLESQHGIVNVNAGTVVPAPNGFGAQPKEKSTLPVPRVRSSGRQRNIPAHFKDFEVSLLPKHYEHSQLHEVAESHSKSSTLSHRSRRPIDALKESLHPPELAQLEERVKQMELNELHHQQQEEEKAEECLRRMDQQAREASMAREQLSNRLNRARKIRQAERDLEEARMLSLLFKGPSPEHRASSSLQPTSSQPPTRLSMSEAGLPAPHPSVMSVDLTFIPAPVSAPPVPQTFYPTDQPVRDRKSGSPTAQEVQRPSVDYLQPSTTDNTTDYFASPSASSINLTTSAVVSAPSVAQSSSLPYRPFAPIQQVQPPGHAFRSPTNQDGHLRVTRSFTDHNSSLKVVGLQRGSYYDPPGCPSPTASISEAHGPEQCVANSVLSNFQLSVWVSPSPKVTLSLCDTPEDFFDCEEFTGKAVTLGLDQNPPTKLHDTVPKAVGVMLASRVTFL